MEGGGRFQPVFVVYRLEKEALLTHGGRGGGGFIGAHSDGEKISMLFKAVLQGGRDQRAVVLRPACRH